MPAKIRIALTLLGVLLGHAACLAMPAFAQPIGKTPRGPGGCGNPDHAALYYSFGGAFALNELTEEEHAELKQSDRLNYQAFSLYQAGKSREAIPLGRESLAIRRKILGEQNFDTTNSLENLALLLRATGDYAEARQCVEQALAINLAGHGKSKNNSFPALLLSNAAFLLSDMGYLSAAQAHYEEALAIRKEVLGEKHSHTAQSLEDLGELLARQGDYAAARPYYEQALAVHRSIYGENDSTTAQSLNNLGALLTSMGDYAAARPYLEQALAIRQTQIHGGGKTLDAAVSLHNLGLLLTKTGDYAAARPYLEQALAISRKVLGENRPNTVRCRDSLDALEKAVAEQGGRRP